MAASSRRRPTKLVSSAGRFPRDVRARACAISRHRTTRQVLADGLAAGNELAQRGIDFVILEKGRRLGENWRPRWDSLRLFTPDRFDGLPGFPFQGEEGRHLTKHQMSEYLEQYAQRFGLPVRLGI